MEQRYNREEIELYYGDEVQISEKGYVPYGWQFKDENISIKSAKGKHINCFGIITRENQSEHTTTYQTITASFIIEKLNAFSHQIKKHTVVVLDNAKVHQSKAIKAMQFNREMMQPNINVAEEAIRNFGAISSAFGFWNHPAVDVYKDYSS